MSTDILLKGFIVARSVVIAVWNLMLFILLCYELSFGKSNHKKMHISVRCTALLNFFTFFTCYTLLSILDSLSITEGPLVIIMWLFFAAGTMLLYLFYAILLYIAFQNTAFTVSKCTLYSHITILLLIVIVPTSLSPLFKSYPLVYNLVFLFDAIIGLLGYIHIVYKFNHNLLYMMKFNNQSKNMAMDMVINAKNKPKEIENSNTNTQTASNLNPSIPTLSATVHTHDSKKQEAVDEELLQSVTKLAWLCTMQIIALGSMALILGILSIIGSNIYIHTIWEWFIGFFICNMVTYIFLGFKVNDKYYKFLCGCCHSRCKRKCHSMAVK